MIKDPSSILTTPKDPPWTRTRTRTCPARGREREREREARRGRKMSLMAASGTMPPTMKFQLDFRIRGFSPARLARVTVRAACENNSDNSAGGSHHDEEDRSIASINDKHSASSQTGEHKPTPFRNQI